MKIKTFLTRIVHWFGNNVWLQLVIIVGGLFTFIFTLPIIVNKIRSSKELKQNPDYFYAQYQVATTKIDSLIDELQQGRSQSKKIVMFTPKNNSVSANIKNSLATLIKTQKINFQVVFIEPETFKTLYQKHLYFFKEITLEDDYFNNTCNMNEVGEFNDFLQNPVLILFEKGQKQQIITNLCGVDDYQKTKFLKKFWKNK